MEAPPYRRAQFDDDSVEIRGLLQKRQMAGSRAVASPCQSGLVPSPGKNI
jgi:hypothetical protein